MASRPKSSSKKRSGSPTEVPQPKSNRGKTTIEGKLKQIYKWNDGRNRPYWLSDPTKAFAEGLDIPLKDILARDVDASDPDKKILLLGTLACLVHNGDNPIPANVLDPFPPESGGFLEDDEYEYLSNTDNLLEVYRDKAGKGKLFLKFPQGFLKSINAPSSLYYQEDMRDEILLWIYGTRPELFRTVFRWALRVVDKSKIEPDTPIPREESDDFPKYSTLTRLWQVYSELGPWGTGGPDKKFEVFGAEVLFEFSSLLVAEGTKLCNANMNDPRCQVMREWVHTWVQNIWDTDRSTWSPADIELLGYLDDDPELDAVMQ